jgi:DNA-binding NarL/FixJ family response regulator
VKVLVADDHPLVRNALARTVLRADPEADVFEAHDFPTTLARFETRPPDLALLDLNMPGMRGCQGLTELRRQFPTIALIVASGQEDPTTVRAVLATGINGFFPKTGSADLLLEAIHLVRMGGVYVPPHALADLRDGSAPKAPDAGGLTARQRDVLRLLMHGLPNKSIARELDLTEGTVKIHIAAILRGLHARNRTEAVIRARELGLDRASADSSPSP